MRERGEERKLQGERNFREVERIEGEENASFSFCQKQALPKLRLGTGKNPSSIKCLVELLYAASKNTPPPSPLIVHLHWPRDRDGLYRGLHLPPALVPRTVGCGGGGGGRVLTERGRKSSSVKIQVAWIPPPPPLSHMLGGWLIYPPTKK